MRGKGTKLGEGERDYYRDYYVRDNYVRDCYVRENYVAPISGAPLLGRLLTSPTNIRLGWKGLPGTNARAYYEKS